MEQAYIVSETEQLRWTAKTPAASAGKRIFDVVVSLGLLVFFAPLMCLIALAIRLDTPGPVFFLQRRTGLSGVPFKIFKFRSMTVAEDGAAVIQAKKNDARVTKVGKLLRRSSLDELPQLLNVLRGDMSLIGPRPHALAHDEYYGATIADYHLRFRTRPGITGLSQVKGYRGETETVESMETRIHFDNHYIDNWSLGQDVWILISTAVVVPLQKTAY